MVDQPMVELVVKKKSDVFVFAEDIMYRSKTRLVSRSPRSRSRSWSKSNGKSRSRTRSRSGYIYIDQLDSWDNGRFLALLLFLHNGLN